MDRQLTEDSGFGGLGGGGERIKYNWQLHDHHGDVDYSIRNTTLML